MSLPEEHALAALDELLRLDTQHLTRFRFLCLGCPHLAAILSEKSRVWEVLHQDRLSGRTDRFGRSPLLDGAADIDAIIQRMHPRAEGREVLEQIGYSRLIRHHQSVVVHFWTDPPTRETLMALVGNLSRHFAHVQVLPERRVVIARFPR